MVRIHKSIIDETMTEAVEILSKVIPFEGELSDSAALLKWAKKFGTRKDPEKFHTGDDREVDAAAILEAADSLSFLRKEILSPNNDFEQKLDICATEESFDAIEVDACIVFGAAGLSIIKRLYHALRLNNAQSHQDRSRHYRFWA